MDHATQVELIKELQKLRASGTNVDAGRVLLNPVEAYTDRDRAAREEAEFFRGHPMLLGLSGELPAPGTFVTTTEFGVPVLATRDSHGTFRAFLNVCRHRGTAVEERRRGTAATFSCPFHGWTYSSEGSLLRIPMSHHFGELDVDSLGLTELPAVEYAGMLIVHPSPGGTIDTEELLGDLGPELEGWDMSPMIRLGDDRYDMQLNWKLAMDTFGETYHFPVLHRDTLAPAFHGNCQLYRTYGRNHRMMLCRRGIDDYTGGGVPEEEWNVLHATLPVYYLFPNVQLLPGPNGVTLVRVFPAPGDPTRSVSEVSFYIRPELEAIRDQLDIDIEERLRVFADIIRDEDYRCAEMSQMGAAAGGQQHVIFGRNEPALHHYHNTYNEALGLPPLEELATS